MGLSFSGWWRLSLLDKISAVRQRYWRTVSRFFYAPQFKSFGTGSVILRPMMIGSPEFIEIGEHTLIRDGVRLQAVLDPYGRKPQLSIGSHTNIEQNVHIVCHSRVTIGSRVAIAACCAIVDVSHPHRDVHSDLSIASRIRDEDSFVEIGDGAFLGYGAVILPNVRVGRSAVIGANSVVTRDVPDFGVVAGAPAILIESYDRERDEWIRAARR
jgi:acetyltransferase-like isoleucine patch superfamily enzyme